MVHAHTTHISQTIRDYVRFAAAAIESGECPEEADAIARTMIESLEAFRMKLNDLSMARDEAWNDETLLRCVGEMARAMLASPAPNGRSSSRRGFCEWAIQGDRTCCVIYFTDGARAKRIDREIRNVIWDQLDVQPSLCVMSDGDPDAAVNDLAVFPNISFSIRSSDLALAREKAQVWAS